MMANMSRIGLWLFGMILLFPQSRLSAKEKPLPQSWHINLAPVVETFAAPLADASPPQRNLLTALQAEVREAELALGYLELWTQLKQREQVQLTREQTEWLAMRAAPSPQVGGDADASDPTSANLAKIRWTEKRTAALRKRLHTLRTLPEVVAFPPISSPIPPLWRLDLQGAFDWLEQDSQDGPITAIVRNHRCQVAICDAELAIVYLELWIHAGKKERQGLRMEQTAWLDTRVRKMRAAAAGRADEPLAMLKTYRVSVLMSQERIVELRRRAASAISLVANPGCSQEGYRKSLALD